MDKRTEEDKLTQDGFKVILGGKEHDVAPLVIQDSREWRKKVIALIAPLPTLAETSLDTSEGFEQALSSMLLEMPNEVIDLFFEYAKDLNRPEIESVTTDEEMSKAFMEVVAFAFPLAGSPAEVLRRLYPAEKTPKTRKKRSR